MLVNLDFIEAYA